MPGTGNYPVKRMFCGFCGWPANIAVMLVKKAMNIPACVRCEHTCWREGGGPDPNNRGVWRGSVEVVWPSVPRTAERCGCE